VDQKYLGDSYDLVKRFWCQTLELIAPLYAHSRFVPALIRDDYTALTSIPILETRPIGRFGILLDPDTGIPLPAASLGGATSSHASLPFLLKLNQEFNPDYIICFDQSHHRGGGLSRERQREAKMTFLRDHGMQAFYYVSHAPFLFAAQNEPTLRSISDRLLSMGMPKCRFQHSEASGL
jgi:hypothetical protein